MHWASAVSENVDLPAAVAECASDIRDDMGGRTPDMVVAFVSAHHVDAYVDVPRLIESALDGGVLIGCSGGGVIGAGREVEQRPGFALTAAILPGVDLRPFHLEENDLPDGDAGPDGWETLVGARASDEPHFLILADPFSLRAEHLLMGLDYAFPAAVKIGGLASGAQQPGGNALFLGSEVFGSGAVGLALRGDLAIDAIVAQGCRPIGKPLQVTACQQNMLMEVDGRTPFEVLRETLEQLPERDRALAQHSLFLGVVMDELKEDPQLGDYLIRNIVGVDAQRGVFAIGEMLKEGQTVQFHLRDAETSAQDLESMLSRYAAESAGHQKSGALLFSCLGRGSYLYGRPDHDTDMFREKLGKVPLTGFFCNGEIGQVGGSTYLHGYTSSFGIFRPKHGAS